MTANSVNPVAKSSCTVRLAKPADCDQIAELAGQLGYPSTAEQIRSRMAEMQKSKQYAVYVAELPEGNIAGWIGVSIFRCIELDACAEINGFVVSESVRSKGLGRVLLAAAENWAREQGCREIIVHCNVIRERAHRFYLSNAFEHKKTQKVLQKVL